VSKLGARGLKAYRCGASGAVLKHVIGVAQSASRMRRRIESGIASL
jgi:hypothetical protein